MVEMRWVNRREPHYLDGVQQGCGREEKVLQYRKVFEYDAEGKAVTATPWIDVPTVTEE
jgi:hypothetical protein